MPGFLDEGACCELLMAHAWSCTNELSVSHEWSCCGRRMPVLSGQLCTGGQTKTSCFCTGSLPECGIEPDLFQTVKEPRREVEAGTMGSDSVDERENVIRSASTFHSSS
ncbi:uncharacterized [Tachysurus ichikawai]